VEQHPRLSSWTSTAPSPQRHTDCPVPNRMAEGLAVWSLDVHGDDVPGRLPSADRRRTAALTASPMSWY
jgi:hypothetical protein